MPVEIMHDGFTRAGHAPLFLEQAQVMSAAANERATLEQRTRWEHGFLAVAITHGLPLIWQGMICRNWSVTMLGLHLLVPPLALLLVFSIMVAGVMVGAGILTGNWQPFAMVSLFLSAALAGVLVNGDQRRNTFAFGILTTHDVTGAFRSHEDDINIFRWNDTKHLPG